MPRGLFPRRFSEDVDILTVWIDEEIADDRAARLDEVKFCDSSTLLMLTYDYLTAAMTPESLPSAGYCYPTWSGYIGLWGDSRLCRSLPPVIDV
jgi:hypothetical protein